MTEFAFPNADHQWPDLLHLQHDGEQLSMSLQIPSSLAWFEGHFPGHPVLPGVVQVLWAETSARHFYPFLSDGYQLKNLKFNRMLLPDSRVELHLTANADKARVGFQYRQQDTVCSSGSFVGRKL